MRVEVSASPCRRSPRSLRSAAAAVGVTGTLAVAIPFGLLLGHNGLITASVNRVDPIPAPHLTDCADRPLKSSHLVLGQCVKLVGTGFAPDELIQVSESRQPGWQTYVRADGSGRFSFRHVAGARSGTGADVISFVGLAHAGAGSVPRSAYCRFIVDGTG
ncbi:MAG TPA: hypothetical protein VHO01_12855 [Jatrophihabitans sp.]|nr:hypothetical protein [Jatrophihabitans sp.]